MKHLSSVLLLCTVLIVFSSCEEDYLSADLTNLELDSSQIDEINNEVLLKAPAIYVDHVSANHNCGYTLTMDIELCQDYQHPVGNGELYVYAFNDAGNSYYVGIAKRKVGSFYSYRLRRKPFRAPGTEKEDLNLIFKLGPVSDPCANGACAVPDNICDNIYVTELAGCGSDEGGPVIDGPAGEGGGTGGGIPGGG